jgi:hypothetical protein
LKDYLYRECDGKRSCPASSKDYDSAGSETLGASACFKNQLIIEIDGAQHGQPDHLHRDSERDARLSAVGFKVLRFWNNEVNENLDGVVETIYLEAMAHIPPLEERVAAKAAGWGG